MAAVQSRLATAPHRSRGALVLALLVLAQVLRVQALLVHTLTRRRKLPTPLMRLLLSVRLALPITLLPRTPQLRTPTMTASSSVLRSS